MRKRESQLYLSTHDATAQVSAIHATWSQPRDAVDVGNAFQNVDFTSGPCESLWGLGWSKWFWCFWNFFAKWSHWICVTEHISKLWMWAWHWCELLHRCAAMVSPFVLGLCRSHAYHFQKANWWGDFQLHHKHFKLPQIHTLSNPPGWPRAVLCSMTSRD